MANPIILATLMASSVQRWLDYPEVFAGSASGTNEDGKRTRTHPWSLYDKHPQVAANKEAFVHALAEALLEQQTPVDLYFDDVMFVVTEQ